MIHFCLTFVFVFAEKMRSIQVKLEIAANLRKIHDSKFKLTK